MKKIKLFIVMMMCALVVVPTTISAEENDTQQVQQDDDYEFVELSREEFINHIAELNDLTYSEAEIQVSGNDFEGISAAIARGERMPRALELRYGYFTSRFYTPSDTKRDPAGSTNAYYGVYASYYLPTGSTSWSSRKFNAIHDTFIYAGNGSSLVTVYTKNANITSVYNIKFSAKFKMKRNLPGMYYVDYTVTTNFGL